MHSRPEVKQTFFPFGRTDMTELTVAFQNFVNAAINLDLLTLADRGVMGPELLGQLDKSGELEFASHGNSHWLLGPSFLIGYRTVLRHSKAVAA